MITLLIFLRGLCAHVWCNVVSVDFIMSSKLGFIAIAMGSLWAQRLIDFNVYQMQWVSWFKRPRDQKMSLWEGLVWCCLMTPGLSKDIQHHVCFSRLVNLQIRQQSAWWLLKRVTFILPQGFVWGSHTHFYQPQKGGLLAQVRLHCNIE